jgi:hypothetical protein
MLREDGGNGASQLSAIRDKLADASRVAAAICDGLTEAQMSAMPAPGAWSIAQCLDHLVTTTEVFAPALDVAIDRARARGHLSSGPWRLGPWGRLLLWYVEPPPVIRLPAPRPLLPMARGPAVEALPRFLESQQVLLSRFPALVGVDLGRATYVSPIARYIRMSLLAFLEVHAAHERRHLWQAGRVRTQVSDQPLAGGPPTAA